ncbi:MAG: histidine phosphatase family protein [Bryobacterales bacterium]|nr:histidine phosphatase family protein [Bryobacterales bacterium]
MSFVYLLRHGQAGTREDYDRLSDLGREQATLLGRSLAEDGFRPAAVYSGELRRQRETALWVAQAFGAMSVQTVPEWNEFDLDAVYAGIAPQLARHDPEFRKHWDELQAAISGGEGAIHRRWTKADTTVVRAWVQGLYDYDGESWAQFCARVDRGFRNLQRQDENSTVIVSTSATPAAICIGRALELPPRQVMRLAGGTFNASYSVIRQRGDDLALVTFNSTAHLREARLRTYR